MKKRIEGKKIDYTNRRFKTIIVLVFIAFLVNKKSEYDKNKMYRENMQSYCDEYLDGTILEVPNSIYVSPYEKILVTGSIIKEYMELYNVELVSLGENIITLDGRDVVRVKRKVGDNLVTSYYSKGDYYDKFGIRSVDFIESIPVSSIEDYDLEVSFNQLQNIINFFTVSEDDIVSLELKHN